MKHSVTVCILLLSLASRAVGQSYVGGAGMVNAGFMWSPALASSLHSLTGNTLQFRKTYAIIGAEMNYRNEKMVLALSGYIGAQEAKPVNDKFAEPFIWKGHGSFGWIIFGRKSLFIYPAAGIGVMESSLTYHTITDSRVHILMRSPSMDISIHSDYFLDKIRSKDFINVSMVGLRVGYTRSLSSSPLPGWSITLSFGGLAFMKTTSEQSPSHGL